MYRIIVAIDVEAPTVDEAYRSVHALLTECAWESTDEWYAPDGEAIPESDISACRLRVLESL